MRSHRMRRIALGVLALAILFALFEVAVRVIPPDQAQIVETDDTGALVASRTIMDARAIAYQRSLVDAQPVWQANLLTQCGAVILPDDDVTIRFFWHGLLLESASSNMSFCPAAHLVSSGGLLTPVRYAGAITMQGVRPTRSGTISAASAAGGTKRSARSPVERSRGAVLLI